MLHLPLKKMHRSKTCILHVSKIWVWGSSAHTEKPSHTHTHAISYSLSVWERTHFFPANLCCVTSHWPHSVQWRYSWLRGLPDSVLAMWRMKSWKDMHQVLNKAIRPSGMWNNGSFQVVVCCERSGGNWMRQKARLAAWLLALDLAALCQGNADRQARLSQHISASSHNPGPCRAGRLSCVQLRGPVLHWSHRS